jgi:hypothetical protein
MKKSTLRKPLTFISSWQIHLDFFKGIDGKCLDLWNEKVTPEKTNATLNVLARGFIIDLGAHETFKHKKMPRMESRGGLNIFTTE